MRMILEGETKILLEMAGEGFEIASEDASMSPYHLLAGSLASCIGLVAAPWAERAGVALDPLTISVMWQHGEGHRVKSMDVELRWPGLPEDRIPVVERLARACPIEETLETGTEISSHVRR